MQHAMDKRPRIRGYYVSGRLKVGWAWGWKFPRRHSKHQAKLVDHDHTPAGGSAPLDLDARNGGSHASQVTQELFGWGIQGIHARVN